MSRNKKPNFTTIAARALIVCVVIGLVASIVSPLVQA